MAITVPRLALGQVVALLTLVKTLAKSRPAVAFPLDSLLAQYKKSDGTPERPPPKRSPRTRLTPPCSCGPVPSV